MKLKPICLLLMIWYLGIPVLSKAQVQDSLIYKPKVAAFIIPTVLISYGMVSLMGENPIRSIDLTTKNELQEDNPFFVAHIDDYLQYAPAAAVYGLHLAGIKGKSSLVDATGVYALSLGIMCGTVTGLKKLTYRERPDQSKFNSFPSGHTANAFAAAEFLNQEYKDISPWYGYAGYTVATATGVLRTYNNRHWVSDVVAGAGFGILSTKVAYLVYPLLKRLVVGKSKGNYSLVPSYQANGADQKRNIGFSFNGTF